MTLLDKYDSSQETFPHFFSSKTKQEIYYSTHLFFLTNKCIYIVAFKLNDPNYSERIKYWLKTIDTVVSSLPRPPIILVGTCSDLVDDNRLLEVQKGVKKISSKLSNVRGYVTVSNLTKKNFDKLENQLVQIATDKKLVNKLVPQFYSTMHSVVKERREDYMTWNSWLGLSKIGGTPEESIGQVTSFLHESGSILWFDEPRLRDLVILNPEWLSTTFRYLLSYKYNWALGVVPIEALKRTVWKEINSSVHYDIIRILEKFEVAFCYYKPNSSKTYDSLQSLVVPLLLPDLPQSLDLQKRELPKPLHSPCEVHERVYVIDFIPLGLFQRLVVRLLNSKGLVPVEMWKSGVCVQMDGDYGLVVIEKATRKEPKHSSNSQVFVVKVKCQFSTQISHSQETQRLPSVILKANPSDCPQIGLRKNSATAISYLGEEKEEQQILEEDIWDSASYEEDLQVIKDKVEYIENKETNEIEQTNQRVEPVPRTDKEEKEIDTAREEREKSSLPKLEALKTPLIHILVSCIDSLLKTLVKKASSIQTYIPCKSCEETINVKAVNFAFATGNTHVSCPSNHSFEIRKLAPDISLSNCPNLSGHVVIQEKLASGAFGSVSKGVLWMDKTLDQNLKVQLLKIFPEAASGSAMLNVAIKQPNNPKDGRFTDFHDEIVIMSKLNHNCLVSLLGIITEPSPLKMVMEYCSLPDLWKHLRSEQLLPAERFTEKLKLKMCLNIASGVHYLHSQKPPIVHKDLRSPNIFVVSLNEKEEVNVKIGDFGMAGAIDPNHVEGLASFQWLAPEVIEGKWYDEFSDVYSVAIIFSEIFTRKVPFFEYNEFTEEKEEVVSVCTVCGEDKCSKTKSCKREQVRRKVTVMKEMEVKDAIVNQGIRPTLPIDLDNSVKEIVESCWSEDAEKRLSSSEIVKKLSNLVGVESQSWLFSEIFSGIDMFSSQIQKNKILLASKQVMQKRVSKLIVAETSIWMKVENCIEIYDLQKEKVVKTLQPHKSNFDMFLTCGQVVTCSLKNANMKFWKNQKSTNLKYSHSCPVILVKQADESRFVSVDKRNMVCLWNEEREILSSFQANSKVLDIVYFPKYSNEKLVISTTENGVLLCNVDMKNGNIHFLSKVPVPEKEIFERLLLSDSILWCLSSTKLNIFKIEFKQESGDTNNTPKMSQHSKIGGHIDLPVQINQQSFRSKVCSASLISLPSSSSVFIATDNGELLVCSFSDGKVIQCLPNHHQILEIEQISEDEIVFLSKENCEVFRVCPV